jgi:acylphosphatase
MDNHSEQKHLRIKGRVQGVGFRYFTRQNARDLKIRGWVKNMPDGSVETVITGDTEQIFKMIKRLWEGPRAALVTDIEELDPGHEKQTFHDFSIRR